MSRDLVYCESCGNWVTYKRQWDPNTNTCSTCTERVTLDIYNYIKEYYTLDQVIMLLSASLMINYGYDHNKVQVYLMQMKEKFETKEYEV